MKNVFRVFQTEFRTFQRNFAKFGDTFCKYPYCPFHLLKTFVKFRQILIIIENENGKFSDEMFFKCFFG